MPKIEETRSNQEVDLIWSSACLQLNFWLAKFLELIYKNKTMNQVAGATISNVLLDDLMLWLSNVYLSSPKSRDFDDSTTVYTCNLLRF